MLARTRSSRLKPAPTEINQGLWHACSGGQRRTAELLLNRGADIAWRPDYAGETTLMQTVDNPDTAHGLLATWLRDIAVVDP